MIKPENTEEMIKEIKKKCVDMDGRENFANATNTSKQYISFVVNNKRPPNEKMLELIGYKLAYVKREP